MAKSVCAQCEERGVRLGECATRRGIIARMVIAQRQDRCPSCGAAVGDSDDECAACGPTAVRAGAAPNKTSLLSRLFARGAPIPPPSPDSLIGREIIGQFVVRQ